MFSCLIHYFKKEMDVFCACVCITLWVLCDIQETQWAENKALAVPCSLITGSFLLWFLTQLVTYWKLCTLLWWCACQCISCIFPYYYKQNCLILFKQHYMDCNIIYLISSWLMSIDVALNKPPVQQCRQEYAVGRCFFMHASAFWAINTGEFCWLVCLGLWWLWPTPNKVEKKREWTEKHTGKLEMFWTRGCVFGWKEKRAQCHGQRIRLEQSAGVLTSGLWQSMGTSNTFSAPAGNLGLGLCSTPSPMTFWKYNYCAGWIDVWLPNMDTIMKYICSKHICVKSDTSLCQDELHPFLPAKLGCVLLMICVC